MPREGSRPRKRKFRGNQYSNSAKKSRVLEGVNSNSTELSGQSTSTDTNLNVSASA